MSAPASTRYSWWARSRYRLVRGAKDLWWRFDRRTRVSRLTGSLYLGGKLTAERSEFLAREGVRAMVSLQEERLDPMDGIDAHLWLPSHDGRPPQMEQLLFGAAFIDAQIRAGRKTYVHCHAGVGRAPTLAAVYLVTQGASPQEALAAVKRARPWINMNRRQTSAVAAAQEAFVRGTASAL